MTVSFCSFTLLVITSGPQGWLPSGYREAHLPNKVVVPEGDGKGGQGGDVTQPYLLSDVYGRHPLPFTRKVSEGCEAGVCLRCDVWVQGEKHTTWGGLVAGCSL